MQIVPVVDDDNRFDVLVDQTLSTIRPKSQRVYRQTYNLWVDWAHNHRIDFLTINAGTVVAFLHDQHVTRATRHRMLSAMRKLAKMLCALDYLNPARKAAYDSLMLVVAPDSDYGTERDKTALAPDEIRQILSIWTGDDALSVRNQALILTLLYTGMRRAELAVTKQVHISLDDATIHIPHGKRDKARDVAIFSDDAIAALKHWLTVLNAMPGQHVYAFPPLDTNGQVIADQPMPGDGVYYVVEQTSKLSGVDFAPHDLRRTLATNALAKGTPLAEVKAQLGHTNEATTLKYAQAGNAQHRRKVFKLDY